MRHEANGSGRRTSVWAETDGAFIWPLGNSFAPDEMNTSFGPRIDANRWDFHDGIDLPAPVGTPVHAMADGIVHRAGPADQVFGSTHVRLKIVDPTDGEDDLFLIYLHLDSLAEGVFPGAQVKRGDVIGAVGQEDATYPHLHFEFRKGGVEQFRSVHPLNYLPYTNTANFTKLRLDRCNFYRGEFDLRAVRFGFSVRNRREGDLQGVEVTLKGEGIEPRTLRVDFDDRSTIVSDKGDEHAFNDDGIAVEGYQKSNLKGERLRDLHYGVLVRGIVPEYQTAELRVLDVRNEKPKSAELLLPELETGKQPVDSRVDFESSTFPPPGWEPHVLPANVCRLDEAAPLFGARSLLCQDSGSLQGALNRAALCFALPIDRLPVRAMSWRLEAQIKATELQMDRGLAIHPLAFLRGDDWIAAACLRRISTGDYVAGVLLRSSAGLFRERTDVTKGKISMDSAFLWELELLRLGTRQTTAVLRLNDNEVVRIHGDTTNVEPDSACAGISHPHSGLQIALHLDRLVLTETPR